MTVEEIIEHEGRSGHLCLMLQGMFMRAYNGSAQTLARLTGYRLKRHSLWSEERPVCYCGFPFAQLERVSALITDAGGILVSRGDGYAEFSGLDVSFDASAALALPLREPRRKKAAMPGGVRSPFPVPPGGKGLPIGNLTSQLFANFYLTPFDHYVKHTLGVRYYGRYADDFVIVHRDREYLRGLVPLLERFLREELGLTLHPRKRWLQHYSRGVSFLGVFIRRDALFTGRRTKEGLYRTVGRWNDRAQERALERCDLEAFRSSVNSYWGLMRHHNSYRLRRSSAGRFCSELTAVTGQVGYRKVTLPDPCKRAKRKRRREISGIAIENKCRQI